MAEKQTPHDAPKTPTYITAIPPSDGKSQASQGGNKTSSNVGKANEVVNQVKAPKKL